MPLPTDRLADGRAYLSCGLDHVDEGRAHWWLDAEKFARMSNVDATIEAVTAAVNDTAGRGHDADGERLTRSIMQALFERFAAIRMVKVSVHDDGAPVAD